MNIWLLDTYKDILDKLESFTKKFYGQQLIKGGLLFLALGLLFWIAVMSLEHLLWLNQRWRLGLFLGFVVVELFLLARFVIVPAAYLFGIRKGISKRDASRIISKHFPEVGDRLLNLLDLSENRHKSELLLASIEQRSKRLKPIPFLQAVKLKDGYSYAKYLVLPFLVLFVYWLSGDITSFLGSHQRVMNYDVAYERPAPFKFLVLNESLEVLDTEQLDVKIAIEGDSKPERVFMVVDGDEILMKSVDGIYTQTITPSVEGTSFYLSGNGWNSREYVAHTIRTPVVQDFSMKLNYPNYLNKVDEVVSGTGNAVIPEGTIVSWTISGSNVDQIGLAYRDTLVEMSRIEDSFGYELRVTDNMDYEVSTSNDGVKNFEKLTYSLEVIKDGYPTVQVEQVLDSINPNLSFYSGLASDDYLLREVRVVCFPASDSAKEQRLVLDQPKASVNQFYYTFPSGFELDMGIDYKVYFEVVDNDGIRGGKIGRSRIFSTRLLSHNQLEDRKLEIQNSVLDNLDKSLKQYKERKDELEELSREESQSKSSTFDRENKIKDILLKQEEQESLMERFSKQIKEGLSDKDEDDEFNRLLKERLERQELEARKNKKLLDELNKIADKISKEDLKSKLEELSKKQNSGARNLEQILELTKRYYVTEKLKQLAQDLNKLSERQEVLSETKLGDRLDNKLQKELNEKFEDISKEIDEVRKDNEALKKPVKLDVSKKDQEDVKEKQREALEEINKHKGIEESSGDSNEQDVEDKVRKRQRSAAQKMKEMSEAMQQGSSGGGGSTITEDAEMLRQILDNLVTFSFKQEQLFEKVESSDVDVSQFSETVRSQKELRRLFEHVDDSLFALSLRRVELSEFVNQQITEVYYNIDKSLESIAENQIFQGASYQQYVVNATNTLADFLADILDNMQQSMKPGQGGGQGQDFQLPDIIEGQQNVQDKMNGSSQGKEGQQGQEGQQGEEGQSGDGQQKEGQGGNEGDKGSEEGSQGGQGQQKGQGSSNGNQEGEIGLDEVYEIYKEQQLLRQQLEKQLENFIEKSDRDLAKKLLRQMEDFENDLLENGITQRTRNKVNNIQHQLMKLENATLKQGEKKEREATTNQNTFNNPITTKPALLEGRTNNVEILNRQALPLRQNYEKKVKVYFRND